MSPHDQGRLGTPRRVLVALVVFAFSLSSAQLAGVAVGLPVQNPFRPDETHVVAEFERAVGLYPQSRVIADGVEVGEVGDIEILADRVRVELELHDIAIAADTNAVLRLRSLIGERYVELDSVWSGEGEQLQSGDVIGLDRTVIPVEITEFLDEAARVSDELDGETLARVIDELAVILADDGQAVNSLLVELDAAGAVVAERAEDIDRTLVALDRLPDPRRRGRDHRLGPPQRHDGLAGPARPRGGTRRGDHRDRLAGRRARRLHRDAAHRPHRCHRRPVDHRRAAR